MSSAFTKKRMSQSQILEHFVEKTGLKRQDIKELFEELAKLATIEVTTNNEFAIPGFGKLVLSERKAREGRNPATGETIQIPAKTTLKFRLSRGLKVAGLGEDTSDSSESPMVDLGGDQTTLPTI
jgi:DNA-binding protein HU-beta